MQKIVRNVMGNIKMKIRQTSSTKEHTLGEKIWWGEMWILMPHHRTPSLWLTADGKRTTQRRGLPLTHILGEWSVLECPA